LENTEFKPAEGAITSFLKLKEDYNSKHLVDSADLELRDSIEFESSTSSSESDNLFSDDESVITEANQPLKVKVKQVIPHVRSKPEASRSNIDVVGSDYVLVSSSLPNKSSKASVEDYILSDTHLKIAFPFDNHRGQRVSSCTSASSCDGNNSVPPIPVAGGTDSLN
jgi:hypothetical protein